MTINQTILKPWAVFRLIPPASNVCVERFRNRNDAIAYSTILQRHNPDSEFQVVFDREIRRTP
jgi:hypothetical protein